MSLVDQAKSIKEIINRIAQQAKPTAQQDIKDLAQSSGAPSTSAAEIDNTLKAFIPTLSNERDRTRFQAGLSGLGYQIDLLFPLPVKNNPPENISKLKSILNQIPFNNSAGSFQFLAS